jgi:hypothetical protein
MAHAARVRAAHVIYGGDIIEINLVGRQQAAECSCISPPVLNLEVSVEDLVLTAVLAAAAAAGRCVALKNRSFLSPIPPCNPAAHFVEQAPGIWNIQRAQPTGASVSSAK